MQLRACGKNGVGEQPVGEGGYGKRGARKAHKLYQNRQYTESGTANVSGIWWRIQTSAPISAIFSEISCAFFGNGGIASQFNFFFSFSGWGETESTWYVGHCWPIVPAPDDRWWWLWSSWWNEGWQGKPKYSEKTCPSATLSTTNPTWPGLGSNPGRRGGNPASNRLSYGTA
jgi:hypothetical protein